MEEPYNDLEGYPEEELQQPIEPPKEIREEAPEIGIIRELSPSKVMKQLRMELKGYSWDYEKEKYVRIEGMMPLMNDKGIGKFLTIVSSVVTDLVTFSSYKEEEVNHLTEYVMRQSIPVIYFNWKDYGIKSKSDLKIVTTKLFNLTLAAFKKAMGAGDRNLVRGTVTESMINRQGYSIPASPKRKRSIWSNINPFNSN